MTATGAIVLAASEEFVALRNARREGSDGQLRLTSEAADGQMVVAGGVGATEAGLLRAGDPSLWDLGLFIFDNASPGAAASIEKLRQQAIERLGHRSQDMGMGQEHVAADSASSSDSASSP